MSDEIVIPLGIDANLGPMSIMEAYKKIKEHRVSATSNIFIIRTPSQGHLESIRNLEFAKDYLLEEHVYLQIDFNYHEDEWSLTAETWSHLTPSKDGPEKITVFSKGA